MWKPHSSIGRTARRAVRCTGWCLSLLALGVGARAEPVTIPFDDPAWERSGDGTVVERIGDRTALRVVSGRAVYRGVDFRDGTIEFDVQMTSYRSFVYVGFRLETDRDHEEVYFRPHKSLLPDAVQYTPVFRGSSQWQLYHGPGATAAARFQPDEWMHVRIVVRGEQAAIFVGDVEVPQLVVPRLARRRSSGGIALRAFEPRGETGRPAGLYTASFSNLVVRPDTGGFDFSAVDPPEPAADRLTSWEVSAAFDPGPGPVRSLPPASALGEWRRVVTDPDGLLLLARDVAKPEGVRRAGVLARRTVRAEGDERRRLDLGYSDEISVFLNGRLLFSGNDSFSFNFPRRQGLLSIDQASVYLPLEAGDNEIVVAVTDGFGGWGLLGRLADPEE